VVITKKTVSLDRMLECDRCKKTKPMDLRLALQDVAQKKDAWVFFNDSSDRCLCPDCVLAILESWYNQQNVENFHLASSTEDSKKIKRHKKVVA